MTNPPSFNLFEMNTVGHISHGMWVHPRNTRNRYTDLEFWTENAKLLEAAFFDTVSSRTSSAPTTAIEVGRGRRSARRCRFPTTNRCL